MSAPAPPPAKKRFVLFVQQKMSEADMFALRALQEGEALLQAHVSLFPVTDENRASLPPPVQAATPLLFDIVTGVASPNAAAVLRTMARKLQSVPATHSRPQPHGGAGGPTARPGPGPGPGPAPVPSEPQPSASRITSVPLDLGDGYGKAQLSEAASLLESRSAIAGQGFAGSGFMGGVGKRGCRLEEDWGAATVAFNEEAANRHMHEAFGLSAADMQKVSAAARAQQGGMSTDSRHAVTEPRAKLKGEDDAELRDLIEKREQLDRMFKERTQGSGGVSSASTSTFSLMEPPQSREERLAGVEGMMSLRPLTAGGASRTPSAFSEAGF